MSYKNITKVIISESDNIIGISCRYGAPEMQDVKLPPGVYFLCPLVNNNKIWGYWYGVPTGPYDWSSKHSYLVSN